MSTTRKKKIILNSVTVDLGCSCRRPRLISNIFQPIKYNKTPTFFKKHMTNSTTLQCHSSSTTSWDKIVNSADTTTTTPLCYSDTESDVIKSLRAVQGFGRIGGESVAVEKESDDPYLDFRRSMLQMILEKEIYSKDDLRELLNCFLQLNSPYHHGIIVRAFSEIWNGVFSVKNSTA